MRDLKFRIWNDYDKKMINWNEMCEQNLANIFTIPSYRQYLMQYTGLHDKNGKEIYEGDIVKVEYQGEIEIYYVRYDESNACFRMFIKTDYFEEPFLDFAEDENELYELIGNIYDTPELLKGEQS